jgi:hypothetical protein
VTELRGDTGRDAWSRPPEIIATEQQILTLADALVTWMRVTDVGEDTSRMADYFTSKAYKCPASEPLSNPGSEVKSWFLERMDPDANRLFCELLRAAWERRLWQVHYHERHPDATA